MRKYPLELRRYLKSVVVSQRFTVAFCAHRKFRQEIGTNILCENIACTEADATAIIGGNIDGFCQWRSDIVPVDIDIVQRQLIGVGLFINGILVGKYGDGTGRISRQCSVSAVVGCKGKVASKFMIETNAGYIVILWAVLCTYFLYVPELEIRRLRGGISDLKEIVFF